MCIRSNETDVISNNEVRNMFYIGRELVQIFSQVKNFIIVGTLWYRVRNIEMKGTNEKRTDLTIHFPPPLDWQEINDLISQSPCFFSNVFLFFAETSKKEKLGKLPPHKYFFLPVKSLLTIFFSVSWCIFLSLIHNSSYV